MARLRRAPLVAADGVPVPLKDRDSVFWADAGSVARLAAELDLTGVLTDQSELERWPVWRRFDVFRAAWCESVGMVNIKLRCLDHEAMRQAGIDCSSSARKRLAVG